MLGGEAEEDADSVLVEPLGVLLRSRYSSLMSILPRSDSSGASFAGLRSDPPTPLRDGK